MASLNTVIFLILSLSMLMGAEETGRWKVVGVAVASVLVQASLRELLPGITGAIISVLATVAFVGAALVGAGQESTGCFFSPGRPARKLQPESRRDCRRRLPQLIFRIQL